MFFLRLLNWYIFVGKSSKILVKFGVPLNFHTFCCNPNKTKDPIKVKLCTMFLNAKIFPHNFYAIKIFQPKYIIFPTFLYHYNVQHILVTTDRKYENLPCA